MKKRRNRLISIALSIGLCAGLAACSGNSGSSDSGKKEDGKTEVTIWIREQMEAPVTAAVEQYNKQQDEVQVNAVVYPDSELTDQLTLAISSGEVPDIVSLDDIRNIMFRQELYHRFTVSKLMTSAPAKLFDTDGMEQVMQTFDDTKAWNLPVVNEEGK